MGKDRIEKVKVVLFLSISILFFSCKKEVIEKKTDFVKTWYDTEKIIPFEATLKINEDNTFEYYGGACDSQFESSGTWFVKNDTIILNSKIPSECMAMTEFGKMCYSKEEIEKIRFTRTIKNCKTTSNKEFNNFSNEKFYIKNDSLVFKKDKKDTCTGFEMVFSNNIKSRNNNKN